MYKPNQVWILKNKYVKRCFTLKADMTIFSSEDSSDVELCVLAKYLFSDEIYCFSPYREVFLLLFVI